MGVDWQAFATAFLNGTALNIKERKDDAEEYEDELIQKAEDNKPLAKIRGSAADAGFQHMLLARQLGADSRTIKAALRSGPNGLANLTKQLTAAKNSFLSKVGPDVQWTPEDVQATVMLGEDWQPESDDDSDAYMRDLINRVYGAKGGALPNSYKAKSSGNWLSERMGFGLKDRIRERLDQDTKYDGMSTYDMSKLDQTKDYDAGQFSASLSYVPLNIFGERMVADERIDIDRVLRLRADPKIDDIERRIKEKQKDSYTRNLQVAEADRLRNNARGTAGQTVDLNSINNRVAKEIAALEAQKIEVRRKVLYDHFSTKMSLFPSQAKLDPVTGKPLTTEEGATVFRKVGYFANMKGDMEDQLGPELYMKLRQSINLPISAELKTAVAVAKNDKANIVKGTYVGGSLGGEANNKKVLDIFKEIERSTFDGETWDDYQGHVDATINTAEKIKDTLKKSKLKEVPAVASGSVTQDQLGRTLVMETSGNTITLVDKENTITSFTFKTAKDENGEPVLDLDGNVGGVPVGFTSNIVLEDGTAKIIKKDDPEAAIVVWNQIGELNGLMDWTNPNNFLPFSPERLAEMEKAGLLDKETDTVFNIGGSLSPPDIYAPTVQSVTEEPIVLAAGKLREVTRAAAELSNEDLINIIEFWKGTQQQLKDPEEREEQLKQYLLQNHSDSEGNLTIKPEDVMPLWTEAYVEVSDAPFNLGLTPENAGPQTLRNLNRARNKKKALERKNKNNVEETSALGNLGNMFSMSASAATNPEVATNINNTDVLTEDNKGLGAKPEKETEVVSAASTDPFVVEHIDELVSLAKSKKNVSSKRSLKNIEEGRLGQWNTLIENWARKNNIELPDKIADRKELLAELADEYIRIMKSE